MSRGRRTSAAAARAASRVMRNGRAGKDAKKAAGSALSQRYDGPTRRRRRK